MTTKEIFDSFTKEEGIKIINSKKTNKEIYDILIKKGLTDSFELFVSETDKIAKELLNKMSRKEILSQLEDAELSDEELQQIAGGKGDFDHDGDSDEYDQTKSAGFALAAI